MDSGRYTIALVVLITIFMTGCARNKTVSWKEEVPLNTGETIFVKRSDKFRTCGSGGGPRIVWCIQKRFYEFEINDKKYKYTTEKGYEPMMIFVDGNGDVSIVNYALSCEKKGYGQYKNIDGKWVLQKNVDPEIIPLRRNLMGYFSAKGNIPETVTQEFIAKSRLDLPQKGGEKYYLTPDLISVNCNEEEK